MSDSWEFFPFLNDDEAESTSASGGSAWSSQPFDNKSGRGNSSAFGGRAGRPAKDAQEAWERGNAWRGSGRKKRDAFGDPLPGQRRGFMGSLFNKVKEIGNSLTDDDSPAEHRPAGGDCSGAGTHSASRSHLA